MRDGDAVKTPLHPGCKLSKGKSESEGSNQNSYATLIGRLVYASVATRPDITYAVNRLACDTYIEHSIGCGRIKSIREACVLFDVPYLSIRLCSCC